MNLIKVERPDKYDLKENFSKVELKGIHPYLSELIEADAREWLDLEFRLSDSYARMQYDWDNNPEGFQLDNGEYVDFVTIGKDGTVYLTTFNDEDNGNWYIV